MKAWIVRFVSLLVFNVVLLLLIGLFTPAKVGWAALWAGIILTAATMWVKPALTRWFQSSAAKSAGGRTKLGENIVQFFLVLAIAFVVWVLTVIFSGVQVHGWLLGWIIPPVFVLIGWAIYEAIDDRVEAHASELYDKADAGIRGSKATTQSPGQASPSAIPSTRAARKELDDGLTAEQRQMLEDLGKS